MYRVSDPYLGVGIPLAFLGVVLAIVLPAHESHATLQHAATAAASQLALLGDGDGDAPEELATLGGEPPAAGGPSAASPPPAEQRPTLLQLVRTLTVWTNNTQMLVVVACITFWETFGSVYLHARVGLDETAIFWVFCGVAVVYVLAALAAGALEIRLRPWARGLLPACTALAAAGCLVSALTDTAGIVEPPGASVPAAAASNDSTPTTTAAAAATAAIVQPLLAGAIVSYGIVAIACAASVALVLPFTVVALDHKVRGLYGIRGTGGTASRGRGRVMQRSIARPDRRSLNCARTRRADRTRTSCLRSMSFSWAAGKWPARCLGASSSRSCRSQPCSCCWPLWHPSRPHPYTPCNGATRTSLKGTSCM